MRYAIDRLLLTLVLTTVPVAASPQTATEPATRPHVETLASERFGGRQAGSEGERLAAEYLAAELTRIETASSNDGAVFPITLIETAPRRRARRPLAAREARTTGRVFP